MAFNFLDDLDKNSDKTKYQKFSVQLGIEEFITTIPFKDATLFEEEVMTIRPSKQSQLKSIVKKYNGILEAK